MKEENDNNPPHRIAFKMQLNKGREAEYKKRHNALWPELKELLKQLQEKPSMKIEIAGHTDNKGSDEYNLRLSQRRADSVIEWLINHSIDPNRLLAKGYGETVPVASNDTEDGCSKNRRTEVRIIAE